MISGTRVSSIEKMADLAAVIVACAFIANVQFVGDMLFTRTHFLDKKKALAGLLTCARSYQMYVEFVVDMLFMRTRL